MANHTDWPRIWYTHSDGLYTCAPEQIRVRTCYLLFEIQDCLMHGPNNYITINYKEPFIIRYEFVLSLENVDSKRFPCCSMHGRTVFHLSKGLNLEQKEIFLDSTGGFQQFRVCYITLLRLFSQLKLETVSKGIIQVSQKTQSWCCCSPAIALATWLRISQWQVVSLQLCARTKGELKSCGKHFTVGKQVGVFREKFG